MKMMPRSTGEHAELLEQFLATRDQRAFAELAGAHLGLVYAAALRITRAADLAQEVSQTVLIKLASLQRLPGVSLQVWLHRITRSAAIDLVRAEERRRRRESVAATLAEDTTDAPDADSLWVKISPLIDEVIAQLPARDRELILSRFFSDCSHGSTARTLGMTEDAVRMRLKRAMDKMRVLLERRGITTSAALLALCLPARASSPLPLGLLAQVSQVSVPPPALWLVALRSFFTLRLASPIPAIALVACMLIGPTGLQNSPTAAEASALQMLPAPPEQAAEPERETASSFTLPPKGFEPSPAEDVEMWYPAPQLEVALRLAEPNPASQLI